MKIDDFLALADEMRALQEKNERLEMELKEVTAFLLGLLISAGDKLPYCSKKIKFEHGFRAGMTVLIDRHRLGYWYGDVEMGIQHLSNNGIPMSWERLKNLYPELFQQPENNG